MRKRRSPPSAAPSGKQVAHGQDLPGAGHVEMVRIKRRSRRHPELLLFKGTPGTAASLARSVQVTIAAGPEPLPAPWYDREQGRIHLSYGSMDVPELVALLADPGGHACYLWESADGNDRHAWLVNAR